MASGAGALLDDVRGAYNVSVMGDKKDVITVMPEQLIELVQKSRGARANHKKGDLEEFDDEFKHKTQVPKAGTTAYDIWMHGADRRREEAKAAVSERLLKHAFTLVPFEEKLAHIEAQLSKELSSIHLTRAILSKDLELLKGNEKLVAAWKESEKNLRQIEKLNARCDIAEAEATRMWDALPEVVEWKALKERKEKALAEQEMVSYYKIDDWKIDIGDFKAAIGRAEAKGVDIDEAKEKLEHVLKVAWEAKAVEKRRAQEARERAVQEAELARRKEEERKQKDLARFRKFDRRGGPAEPKAKPRMNAAMRASKTKYLDLPATATLDEIKKKFRKIAMVSHPDRGGDADTFDAIQQAYNELMEDGEYVHPDEEAKRSAESEAEAAAAFKKRASELGYLASGEFRGERQGFVFRSGELGLGYYFDMAGFAEYKRLKAEAEGKAASDAPAAAQGSGDAGVAAPAPSAAPRRRRRRRHQRRRHQRRRRRGQQLHLRRRRRRRRRLLHPRPQRRAAA